MQSLQPDSVYFETEACSVLIRRKNERIRVSSPNEENPVALIHGAELLLVDCCGEHDVAWWRTTTPPRTLLFDDSVADMAGCTVTVTVWFESTTTRWMPREHQLRRCADRLYASEADRAVLIAAI